MCPLTHFTSTTMAKTRLFATSNKHVNIPLLSISSKHTPGMLIWLTNTKYWREEAIQFASIQYTIFSRLFLKLAFTADFSSRKTSTEHLIAFQMQLESIC